MKKVALVLVALLGWSAAASAQTEQPPPEVATETLLINYQPEEDLVAPIIIDKLAPETVLTILATGFESNTTGVIKQCVRTVTRLCRNQLPVRFDDFGSATFQYLITNGSDPGLSKPEPCRLGAARCTIELGAAGRISVIDTVFIDEVPPPGSLIVVPRSGLFLGDTMTVTGSQFEPREELIVMLCAEPSTRGPRCGAPGPDLRLTTSSDGTAQADLTLDALVVGSDRVSCGRQVPCNMVVTSDQGNLRARPVQLFFAAGPGVDYDSSRVIIGFALAIVLVMGAGWLIRSTDWAPPSESDSTPIDEAEYADLDAEADQYEQLGGR